MIHTQGLDHIAIRVSDQQRSIQWYQDILGLERRFQEQWGGTPAMMCAGNTCIALFPTSTSHPTPIPGYDVIRNSINTDHIAFRVTRQEYEKAKQFLQEKNIDFEEQDHHISHSIYFYDPDGHQLEITTYELS